MEPLPLFSVMLPLVLVRSAWAPSVMAKLMSGALPVSWWALSVMAPAAVVMPCVSVSVPPAPTSVTPLLPVAVMAASTASEPLDWMSTASRAMPPTTRWPLLRLEIVRSPRSRILMLPADCTSIVLASSTTSMSPPCEISVTWPAFMAVARSPPMVMLPPAVMLMLPLPVSVPTSCVMVTLPLATMVMSPPCSDRLSMMRSPVCFSAKSLPAPLSVTFRWPTRVTSVRSSPAVAVSLEATMPPPVSLPTVSDLPALSVSSPVVPTSSADTTTSEALLPAASVMRSPENTGRSTTLRLPVAV